jgi:hypothetical protein
MCLHWILHVIRDQQLFFLGQDENLLGRWVKADDAVWAKALQQQTAFYLNAALASVHS